MTDPEGKGCRPMHQFLKREAGPAQPGRIGEDQQAGFIDHQHPFRHTCQCRPEQGDGQCRLPVGAAHDPGRASAQQMCDALEHGSILRCETAGLVRQYDVTPVPAFQYKRTGEQIAQRRFTKRREGRQVIEQGRPFADLEAPDQRPDPVGDSARIRGRHHGAPEMLDGRPGPPVPPTLQKHA